MINSWNIGLGTVIRHKLSGSSYIIIGEAIVDTYGLRYWPMIRYRKYNHIFRLVRVLEEANFANYEIL